MPKLKYVYILFLAVVLVVFVMPFTQHRAAVARYCVATMAFDIDHGGESQGPLVKTQVLFTFLGAARLPVFDIDGDGQGEAVDFDLDDRRALLVDVSKVGPEGFMNGKALLVSPVSQCGNVSELSAFDRNGDRILDGGELERIKLWFDDGDNRTQPPELKSPAEMNIVSIPLDYSAADGGKSTMMTHATTSRGERLPVESRTFFESGSMSSAEQRSLENIRRRAVRIFDLLTLAW